MRAFKSKKVIVGSLVRAGLSLEFIKSGAL
jgi:hypothetical protein